MWTGEDFTGPQECFLELLDWVVQGRQVQFCFFFFLLLVSRISFCFLPKWICWRWPDVSTRVLEWDMNTFPDEWSSFFNVKVQKSLLKSSQYLNIKFFSFKSEIKSHWKGKFDKTLLKKMNTTYWTFYFSKSKKIQNTWMPVLVPVFVQDLSLQCTHCANALKVSLTLSLFIL